jgi:hypothetical protein
MPREFNLSPEAAVQCCEFCTLRGFLWGKAASNEFLVIQVMEAPVLNNQEKVFPPAIAVSLGLILSPLKGIIRSKNLLHVAIEIVHKFKINCGMTCAAYMRGVMMLFSEKPLVQKWTQPWDCCFVARYWVIQCYC